jgi:hypothetical protein
MNKNEILLAAMASIDPGTSFGPAQLQKLMFLIDAEIPQRIGGPFFSFEPYDYGPFDKEVYNAATSLQKEELLDIDHSYRFRKYLLSDRGYSLGRQLFDSIEDQGAKSFVQEAAKWVKSVSFQEMVSAIYKQYPKMKEKSIFS